MSSDLEKCKQALAEGDATAFIAVADAYNDMDHPSGAELTELAITITTESDDWAVVQQAASVFLLILESLEKKS